MEFPIIRRLPIPEECQKIVEKFVHEAHPTAKLIVKLHFYRFIDEFFGLYTPRPTLKVWGDGIRVIDELYFPPRFRSRYLSKKEPMFAFDEHSGECLFRRNSLKRTCKVRPWTPEPFIPRIEEWIE